MFSFGYIANWLYYDANHALSTSPCSETGWGLMHAPLREIKPFLADFAARVGEHHKTVGRRGDGFAAVPRAYRFAGLHRVKAAPLAGEAVARVRGP
jgi:hypothetical protein